ncbi:MAG TPA: RluA family pseudouridine synthase [Prosthecobacter sp.]|nr:RluA family pseudouridine synthase [Prosthecobacter sp.]
MQPPKTVTEPSELQPFLFAAWPEVKKTKVRQWLKFGAVRVNDRAVTRHDHPLRPGDKVHIQPEKPNPAAEALPEGMRVLFEDESIIVIEKPANLLSVATDKGMEDTAYTALTDYVKQRSRKPAARVWIVHRLDRETSGVMVFARTEEAKKFLQTEWQRMEKRYLAVVEGQPPKQQGTLRHHVDESQPHRVFIRAAAADTREAVTHYRVLRTHGERTLVELTLETGRRHQIRVQLAEIGCPVAGDGKYGAKSAGKGRRLALHASWLKILHPDTGKETVFEAPLPAELAGLVRKEV